MHTVNLALLLIACACFAVAAVKPVARVNLVALGLLAAFLVPLIAYIRTA